MKIKKITIENDFQVHVTNLESEIEQESLVLYLKDFRLQPMCAYQGKKKFFIEIKDISHFKIENDLVFAFVNSAKYRLDASLNECLAVATYFVRVNKQTVVNLYSIDYLKPELNGIHSIFLKNDDVVKLSRTYYKPLLKKIGEYNEISK